MNNQFIIDIINSNIVLAQVDFNKTYINELKNDINSLINFNKNLNGGGLSKINDDDINDYYGYGNIDISNSNIYLNLYNSFQNVMFPLPIMTNETNFLYCLFNENNPIDMYTKKIFPNITISLTSELDYTISYNNDSFNYIIVMLIIYIVKIYVKQIFNIQKSNPQSIGYYLFSNTLTKISDLNSIVFLLPKEIIISSFCIYNIINKLNLDSGLNTIKNSILFPNETIESLTIIHINIIRKIIYSCISSFLFSDLNSSFSNMCFTYKQSNKKSNLIYYFDNPILTNGCVTCSDTKLLTKYFINPKIVTYQILIDTTKSLLVTKTNLYWYNIFTEINDKIIIENINLKFTSSILIKIPIEYDFLDIFFDLFYILENNIIISNSDKNSIFLYFAKNSLLYAKPSSFIPIDILPGIIDTNYSERYIKSISNLYKLNDKSLNQYFQNGIVTYKSTILIDLLSIKEFIKLNKNNSIKELLNKLTKILNNDSLKLLQLLVLINKKINSSSMFIISPFNEINVYDLNKYLFIYIFSKTSFLQNIVELKDLVYDCQNVNINLLIDLIETKCITYFNTLTDKNDIYTTYPLCKCLYQSNDNISPYCFDEKCKTWITDDLSIYKKYPCKYPTCSQGIDISNMISPSIDLNYTLNKLQCASYDFKSSVTSGKYNIYFIDNNNVKYMWIKNDNIVINRNGNTKNNIFNIEVTKTGSLIIKNIDIINGYLIESTTKNIECIQSLLSNKLYLIHKKFNIPLICDLSESNIIKCSFSSKSFSDILIKIILIKVN